MSMSTVRAAIWNRIGALFASVLLILSLSGGSALAQPVFSLFYSPDTIGPGGTSVGTYTIDNSGSGSAVTDLAFTHTLPAGVTFATPSNVATSCSAGGTPITLTAPDGGSALTFSDAQLAGGSTCTVTVQVTSSTVATHSSTTGDLTSSAGNSGTASDDLTVVATLPGFSKGFAPTTVSLNGTSTLTYTIDNSANAAVIGNLDFTEILPASLQIASPANASTDCVSASAPNTTLTAVPGSSTITLDASGSTFFPGFEVLSAGATCTVAVDVQATGVGTHAATSGDLLADFTSAGTSTATLTVNALSSSAPTLTKVFDGDPVGQGGGTVSLTFTILNNDPSNAATSLAFTDDLAAFLTGATLSSLESNDCGGSVSGVGSTSIGFSGGSVAARSSCNIVTNVQIPAAASVGTHTNTTSAVTAIVDGNAVTGNTASDTLEVINSQPPTLTAVWDNALGGSSVPAGGTARVTYTLTNNSTTSGATDVAFTNLLAPPFGFPVSFNTTLPMSACGGTLTQTFPDTDEHALSLTGGTLTAAPGPGNSCTFEVEVNVPSDMSPSTYSLPTSTVTATVDGGTQTGNSDSPSLTVTESEDLILALTKVFDTDQAGVSETIGMTFTISNTGPAADTISFTDDLDTFQTGAVLTSVESNDCGGSVGGTGTGTFSFSGGTLAGDTTCDIATTITLGAADTGFKTNTTSDLTAALSGGSASVLSSTAASDSLNVLAYMPLEATLAFIDDPAAPGDTVTARYTISNPNAAGGGGDGTGISFTHNIRTNITDVTLGGPLPSNPCGTGSSLTDISGFFLLMAGGNIVAGDSCSFDVPVVVGGGAAEGAYLMEVTSLTQTVGGVGITGDAFSDNLEVGFGVESDNPMVLTKSFDSDFVLQGGSVGLTFTLENTGAEDASALAFSDDLDAFLTNTVFSAVTTNTCNGTVSGTGTGSFGYTGGTLTAGNTCSVAITVDVDAAAVVDTYTNTTSAVTGTRSSGTATGPAATDDLEVRSSAVPTFSKSFAPTEVTPTETTVLTYTISNPASGSTRSGMAFSDDLDSALTGATVSSLPATPCGAGSSLAGSGTGFLTFTGGELAAGANCSFDVTVTAPASAPVGDYTSTSSDLSAGGLTLAAGASDTLSVAPVAPSIAKSFAASVPQGGSASMTVTLTNNDLNNAASAAAFSDDLSAMVSGATLNAITSNTCGGSVVGTGTSALGFSGGSIAANSSCTIVVTVGLAGTEAAGDYVNTTSTLAATIASTGVVSASTASATLTVTAAPAPDFTKVFGPDSIAEGGTSTLTFTIDNSGALIAATALDFTDTLPSGVTVASTPNASTTCTGGTLTAAADSGTISYTGGSVAAGASCTVEADVTSVLADSYTNTTGDLTSSLGNSGTATDDLTVTPAPAPGFAKVFGPDSIAEGGTSTLTFTIDNSGALIAATALDFTDTLPSGVTVAGTPNASTTCTGGTLTATADSGSISYTGGSVAAGASCTVVADVTSVLADSYTNTTGDLTSSLGNSGTAMDDLTVTAAPTPGFTKVFGPDSFAEGGISTLTFTIDNSGALIAATALDFTDTLPSGVTVASTPNASTTCTGGTLTATADSGSISYTGGSVAAGASCTVVADVTSVLADSYTNTTGDLTSSLGNSGTATDDLTVTAAPTPGFAKVFSPDTIVAGDITTLTFTIDNSSALIDATALDFTDDFPEGLVIAPTPNASTTCTGGTLTATAEDVSVSYSGGSVAAGASCTIDVDVRGLNDGSYTNTSGDLTSSLGNSGTASDDLTVTAAPVLTIAKVFAPDTVDLGGISTLTLTITNPSLLDVSDFTVTDTFPAGMEVADPANPVATCGGVGTGDVGDTEVSFADGEVAAGENCTISIDVLATDTGALVNTTGDLVSALGNSGTASDTLTVNAPPAPGFTKVFAPDSISVGEISTLTFTIDNAGALVPATALDFTDAFPAGLVIASTPNAATTCTGGTLTAVADGDTVSYTGGTVAEGTSCTIDVDVTSFTADTYSNTTGDLTSSLGNSGTATDDLTVAPATAPIMTQRFDPDTIVQGGISTLIVTIDNTANFVPASGLGFSGTFDINLNIADPSNATSTCGGTLTANPRDTSFSFSGGTVTAGATCEVEVDVTAVSTGALSSSLSALSSSNGTGTAPADVEVTVDVNTNAYVTFVQSTDQDGTYSYASSESDLTFDLVTTAGSGSVGPIEVPSGSYSVTMTPPAGVGTSAISCSDDNSTADAPTGLINLELSNFENVTCTITNQATSQQTVDTINNFLHNRNNLLLSNQPNRSRRLERLNSGGQGSQAVNFARGDITSMLPFDFDLMSIGSGNYNIATSAQRVREARAKALVAHNPEMGAEYIANTRWDVWFEGSYNEFSGGSGDAGHFALGYLGADYVFSEDLLVGMLVQFDQIEDNNATAGSSVSGNGWMAGPYVTARLADNLIFDGRFALGKSTNDISPFGTYTDTFETDRFLLDASLSGQFDLDNGWQMSPNLSLSYIQEDQASYVDSLGVTIPSQKVNLGQLRFGPNFSRSILRPNGTTFSPFVTLDAIYNFSSSSGAVLSTAATEDTEGFRARLESGFGITNRHGTQFNLGVNYDGIGSDYESYGATFKLTIPLQ